MPPGPVQNLQVSGGGGLFISFYAPADGTAVAYRYQLQGGPPTPAIIWTPPSSNLNGPFDIPYDSTSLDPDLQYAVSIVGVDSSSQDGQVTTSQAVTLGTAGTAFSATQAVSATEVVTTTNNTIVGLNAGQSGTLTTATLAVGASSKVKSIDSTTARATTQAVNVQSAQISTSDAAIAALGADAVANAPPDSTLLAAVAYSATDKLTGAESTAQVDVSTTVTVESGVSLSSAQIWVNNGDGTTSLAANCNITPLGNNQYSVAYTVFMFSIYFITIVTSSGTTVQIPVENNQAYNDYLHDESGYQNRRENRLLTSGFYRGPVDSSTLTRIRSANGVLLGVNGVPGGMQGSRCCR